MCHLECTGENANRRGGGDTTDNKKLEAQKTANNTEFCKSSCYLYIVQAGVSVILKSCPSIIILGIATDDLNSVTLPRGVTWGNNLLRTLLFRCPSEQD